MKRSTLVLTLLAVSTLTAACSTHKAPQAPQSAGASAPEASAARPQPHAAAATAPVVRPRPGGGQTLGDGVKWFRTAAEYKAITVSTYRAATQAVLNGATGKERDSWAVVLDADETVLDNSVFQRDLSRGVAPFSEELWAAFVRQRSAVPVPGAKAFLDRVKELGVASSSSRTVSTICARTRVRTSSFRAFRSTPSCAAPPPERTRATRILGSKPRPREPRSETTRPARFSSSWVTTFRIFLPSSSPCATSPSRRSTRSGSVTSFCRTRCTGRGNKYLRASPDHS